MFNESTPAERVAGIIRGELARQGVRGSSVGDAIGLGPAAVSRRVNGWTPFTLDEVGILASLLRLSPDALGAAIVGPGDDEGSPP